MGCKAILIEPKNIFFLSSIKQVLLPVNTFKSILYCGATTEYQCGRLTQTEYIQRLASDFGHSTKDIETAIWSVRDSLRLDEAFWDLLMRLKAECNSQVKFCIVTNLSQDDYAYVKNLGFAWDSFDHVFVSSDLSMRKPELRFFHHVLASINLKAEEVLLIDYEVDNILTALSLGMQGVVYSESSSFRSILKIIRNDDSQQIAKQAAQAYADEPASPVPMKTCILRSKLSCIDAVMRGKCFLQQNARRFPSMTHIGVPIQENFAQLLILELTGDQSLITLEHHETTWNFFIGTPVLTQANSPDDMDTTSLAITILNHPTEIANQVMDEILNYRTQDDLVQTYFTTFKNRVDPVVCCNVLSLFYQYNRGHELGPTLSWIHQVILHRAYIHGTSYYPMPESFLFFFSRLLPHLRNHEPALHAILHRLLVERIEERIGVVVDAASLAMRLIVCAKVGVVDPQGVSDLLGMQSEIDGGWEFGKLYRYASKDLNIGNRGTTTALAIDALEKGMKWL